MNDNTLEQLTKDGWSYRKNNDDDIPRIYLTGNKASMSKENSVDLNIKYVSKNLNFEGVANVKWQGNSSLYYPKKNYTIKLFKDSSKKEILNVNFKRWGGFNKFVLKANYIDFSHARNIVSARIWGNVVSDREGYNNLPDELKTSPNNGAIDGFLVRVFVNGVYQGRYTLTYGKDAIMWNMDKNNPNHAALCSENYESGCFAAEAEIDESDWSLEFPSVLTDEIKMEFNNAIRFVMNSSDEEFVANIRDYFDLESLIDYYIFAYVSCGLDSMGKNQIFLTYDGKHWIASMYDMDSTWGIYWDGSYFVSTTYRCQEDYESSYNRPDGANALYTRLASLFADTIKERYKYLRTRSLSVYNIIEEFEKFMTTCSESLAAKDLDVYPDIPSSDTDHAEQIRQYVVARLKYVDFMIVGGTIHSDYNPNGESWVDEVDVNFESDQYIEVKIDTIGDGYNENILSIGGGTSISEWFNDGPTMHLYANDYGEGNGNLLVSITNSEDYTQDDVSITLPLTLKLDKDGFYINGVIHTPTDNPDFYNEYLNEIIQNNTLLVGSVEGINRSNAHYEYIKVDE